MSHGRPSCLGVSRQCGKIGCNGGSNVLAQHQCRSQLKTDPAVGAHNQGDSHRRRRRLHNHRQYRANEDEQQDGKESHVRIILHKSQHVGILLQVGSIGLQHGKSHKEEGETKNKLTD